MGTSDSGTVTSAPPAFRVGIGDPMEEARRCTYKYLRSHDRSYPSTRSHLVIDNYCYPCEAGVCSNLPVLTQSESRTWHSKIVIDFLQYSA
ncbi:hypothetical protein EVAR_51808_1 [Eumeta japonica]|uniref:Uncharacterized protein n=1 Tax=Eumeta variegata TaxID=151549 RepID=A0A4C1XV30_EUMVA|nr:hypothetical protein EVAR_51808_1 [Eumeta japonica]